MSSLQGYPQAFEGDTSAVHSSELNTLGTRGFDKDGNEFIYLLGVASTGAGSVVTYDEAHATALIAANAIGRVAVAMAALVASKYGWYQIYGKNTITKSDTVAADKPVYIDGTAGRIDDAAVAGDWISGMWTRSADTSNVCTTELNYPAVHNDAYLT